MIPISLFNVLIAVMVLLVIYSFVDTRNKLYGNIVAAFLAALLGVFLGVVIVIGIVQYDPAVIGIGQFVYVNTTTSEGQNISYTNVSTYVATCDTCTVPIFDPAVGYIILLFGVIMMIYALLMIYEAYIDYKSDREGE